MAIISYINTAHRKLELAIADASLDASPMTRAQAAEIGTLCEEAGHHPPRPDISKSEASKFIEKLRGATPPAMPEPNPHALPELTNEGSTPGTGMLPEGDDPNPAPGG